MALGPLLSELPKLYKASTSITGEAWYIVAAVVITTLNRPQDIPQLYRQASDGISSTTEQDTLVLRLKEGIFKSSPIIGLPKVINALSQLNTVLPEDIKQRLPTCSSRPISEWQDVLEHRQRGAALFDKIYDRHASRVRNNLEMDYPDLAQVALEDTYGRVLSSSDRVDALDTSFVVLAGLMVQDLPSQLKGHYYGAIHHGATDQQLGNLQIIVEKLCLFYNHQDYCSLPFKTK